MPSSSTVLATTNPMLVDLLIRLQHVFKPHQLETTGHGQPALIIEAQTHRLRHARLMDVDAALGIEADEIEQAGLVGCKGQ